MKKHITLISVALVILLVVIWGIKAYNSVVQLEENTTAQWAQVENQYKRRADLIPNLVNTVKGYAKHEKSTLESVISARAKSTQITVDPQNLTPEKLKEYQAAQGELSAALGKLLAIQENYPDLKANQNFQDLQAQLEGTENRIAVARMDFNNACKNYNTKIRQIPYNFMGFETKAYFETTKAEEQTPNVNFD